MEETVYDCQRAGIAVDLLVGAGDDGLVHFGVRLRTFGRNVPKDKMILAEGATFADALATATEYAIARAWTKLDWGSRPWAVGDRRTIAPSNYGL